MLQIILQLTLLKTFQYPVSKGVKLWIQISPKVTCPTILLVVKNNSDHAIYFPKDITMHRILDFKEQGHNGKVRYSTSSNVIGEPPPPYFLSYNLLKPRERIKITYKWSEITSTPLKSLSKIWAIITVPEQSIPIKVSGGHLVKTIPYWKGSVTSNKLNPLKRK